LTLLITKKSDAQSGGHSGRAARRFVSEAPVKHATCSAGV
jgi:hypothetical protein